MTFKLNIRLFVHKSCRVKMFLNFCLNQLEFGIPLLVWLFSNQRSVSFVS